MMKTDVNRSFGVEIEDAPEQFTVKEGRPKMRRSIHIETPRAGTRSRQYLLVLLPAAVAVLATSLWLWLRPPVVDGKLWVGTVQAGELRVGISGHGKLVPSGLLSITSTTGGSVAAIHALSGTKLQKGDPIITLRNLDLLQQLSAAEKVYSDKLGDQATAQSEMVTKRIELKAALDNARDALAMAEMELKTQSQLAESGVVSKLQVEKERTKVASVRRQVTQAESSLSSSDVANDIRVKLQATAVTVAKAQMDRLKEQANELVLRAPETGVVYELMEGITVGSTVNVGTLIAKIATQSDVSAELQIPASHAGEVILGQPVDLTVDDKQITGRVQRIDPRVQQDEVRISVGIDSSKMRGLLAGQPVTGEIVVNKMQDTVYVPRPAGVTDGMSAQIFEVNRFQHRLLRHQVQFGKSEGRFIVVESGLNPGAEIVLSDMEKMKSFKQVRYNQ